MINPRCKSTLAGAMLAALSLGGALAGAAPQAPAPSSAPATERPEDEKAVKQVADAFVRAFNAGDARSVAALYADDAEMIDEFGGRIQGRPLIQEFYTALFNERKGATIEIALGSIRFLGPEVAKEVGQTRVKPAGGEPPTVRDYSLIYVKQGERWMYSSVREEHPIGLAHHERLEELEWMTGEWLDESSESIIHASCRWSEDKNFLLRDFVIHIQGKPVMNVTQRIGWDPLTKQIKSWVFDSDGGHGEALWTRDGNRWIIKSTGVLPDGRVATATNTLTRTGSNSARWASKERTVGGEVVADQRESVMVRRPPQPQGQPPQPR